MAIRGDSFSSTSEVKAFTRHLLKSNSTAYTTFNSTTRPTLTEVEKFIDRISGVLNVAIWRHGINPAAVLANSTARLSADEWVTDHVVARAELTQRGEGYGSEESNRYGAFVGLTKSANEMVEANYVGWQLMGLSVSVNSASGLRYTGLDAQDIRTDPDDSSLEQPVFKRKQFDSKGGIIIGDDNGDS